MGTNGEKVGIRPRWGGVLAVLAVLSPWLAAAAGGAAAGWAGAGAAFLCWVAAAAALLLAVYLTGDGARPPGAGRAPPAEAGWLALSALATLLALQLSGRAAAVLAAAALVGLLAGVVLAVEK